MRALTRMRTLAAVCALLLVTAGTGLAGGPGKPPDRNDVPTGPPPTVGDPDEPGGSGMTTFVLFGRVYLLRVPAGFAWRSRSVARGPSRAVVTPLGPRRGSHAR